jgi:hypothetical protein
MSAPDFRLCLIRLFGLDLRLIERTETFLNGTQKKRKLGIKADFKLFSGWFNPPFPL